MKKFSKGKDSEVVTLSTLNKESISKTLEATPFVTFISFFLTGLFFESKITQYKFVVAVDGFLLNLSKT